jgi:glycosyltransferase involved in cell wall biosynthesis
VIVRPRPMARPTAGAKSGGVIAGQKVGAMTPKSPLVSVVITTRNRATVLPRALDSVFAQVGGGREFDLEVIVVDDASDDETPQVADRYPTVRFVRLPVNRGISRARNAGIEVCRGNYVAFLDDDDVWLPHKLHLQVSAMAAHPEVGVVYSQAVVRFQGRESICPDSRTAPSGDIFLPLLLENFCGNTLGVLLRRAALERARFAEALPIGEDFDLWLRLAHRVPFLFVPGIVAVYQRSVDGSWSKMIADGTFARAMRTVVDGALALRAETGSSRLARKVHANVDLSVAWELVGLRRYEAARHHLRMALDAFPELTVDPGARKSLAHVAGAIAATSAAPLAAAREFCAGFRAEPIQGTGMWVRRRRLMADVWWETAAIGRAEGRLDARTLGTAAAQVVLAYPPNIRRKALLALIAGGVRSRLRVRKWPR